MALTIYSSDPESMRKAEELVRKYAARVVFDPEFIYKSPEQLEVHASFAGDDRDKLLDELLALPQLDFYNSDTYSDDDRGSSWWTTRTQESVTNPDGTREIKRSAETHWA